MCYEVGICLHTEAGDKLYRVRNYFVCHQKRIFQRASLRRKLLEEGFVVCRLYGQRDGDTDPFAKMLAVFDGAPPETTEAKQVEVFWHLSFTNFSPYQTAYRPMVLLPEQKSAEEIELEAT